MLASIQPGHLALAGLCALTPTFLYAGALTAAGFTVGGIAFGTAAALWMSMIGNVPAGSLFAAIQSAGTLGVTGLAFSPPLLVLETTIFAATLYGIETNKDDLPPNVLAALDLIESARLQTEYAIKTASDHVSELYTEENLETAKRYTAETTQAIVVNAENTLEAIDYYLTLIKNHENVDTTRKNAENAITIFLESARNALLGANSRLLEFNTQENVDLVREHAENVHIYAQRAAEAASLSFKKLMTQENVDSFRKYVEDATSSLIKNAENVVTTVNSAETHEKIELLKSNAEKVFYAFVGNARELAENAIKAINSQENVDLIQQHAKDAAINARFQMQHAMKASGQYMDNTKQRFMEKRKAKSKL
ncbi:unnamed protein product [Mucor hiemalis]